MTTLHFFEHRDSPESRRRLQRPWFEHFFQRVDFPAEVIRLEIVLLVHVIESRRRQRFRHRQRRFPFSLLLFQNRISFQFRPYQFAQFRPRRL